jgi:hypothetical protein
MLRKQRKKPKRKSLRRLSRTWKEEQRKNDRF